MPQSFTYYGYDNELFKEIWNKLTLLFNYLTNTSISNSFFIKELIKFVYCLNYYHIKYFDNQKINKITYNYFTPNFEHSNLVNQIWTGLDDYDNYVLSNHSSLIIIFDNLTSDLNSKEFNSLTY